MFFKAIAINYVQFSILVYIEVIHTSNRIFFNIYRCWNLRVDIGW